MITYFEFFSERMYFFFLDKRYKSCTQTYAESSGFVLEGMEFLNSSLFHFDEISWRSQTLKYVRVFLDADGSSTSEPTTSSATQMPCHSAHHHADDIATTSTGGSDRWTVKMTPIQPPSGFFLLRRKKNNRNESIST